MCSNKLMTTLCLSDADALQADKLEHLSSNEQKPKLNNYTTLLLKCNLYSGKIKRFLCSNKLF